MNEKDLRKLTRAELLELFLEQCKRNEILEKELADAKAKLADREIRIANSGTLAEASLALTKIFDEAQKAADLYLENVQAESGRLASEEELEEEPEEEPVIEDLAAEQASEEPEEQEEELETFQITKEPEAMEEPETIEEEAELDLEDEFENMMDSLETEGLENAIVFEEQEVIEEAEEMGLPENLEDAIEFEISGDFDNELEFEMPAEMEEAEALEEPEIIETPIEEDAEPVEDAMDVPGLEAFLAKAVEAVMAEEELESAQRKAEEAAMEMTEEEEQTPEFEEEEGPDYMILDISEEEPENTTPKRGVAVKRKETEEKPKQGAKTDRKPRSKK